MNGINNPKVVDGSHLPLVRGGAGLFQVLLGPRLFQIGMVQSPCSFFTNTNRYFHPWMDVGLSRAERNPGRPRFLSALDKPTSIHGWKYRFVFVKKKYGDWTIPIWNKRGPNKTWNKPRTTPNKREMATIDYFQVVDSVHPRSRKSIKVPGN